MQETFLNRLIIESADLQEKKDKLDAFIKSEKFWKLPLQQCSLLKQQLHAMELYNYILLERIKLLS